VYRDAYPRSGPAIHWLNAGSYLANFLLVILFTYALWVTFCVPQFQYTAAEPGDLQSLVVSVFRSMLPATLTLVLMHYGVLHCWLNFWAELLCFGDRGVAYEDWWCANGFASFDRKWNQTVGIFLRTYVYQDSIRFSRGALSRNQAQGVVFLISSVIHEIIVDEAAGFFFPILLLLFGGPGVVFTRISERVATNVFLWAMLIIGTGILLVCYSREWYARFGVVAISEDRVHQEFHPLVAPFIPRSVLAFYWAPDAAALAHNNANDSAAAATHAHA
jgi:sterol O-acyltransferase